MEFRLVYQGPLLAAGNTSRRAQDKHEIRKQIHKQLAALWEIHPLLKALRGSWGRRGSKTFDEYSGRLLFGFNFLALVNERLNQVCALDILLLRREKPGSLITRGGDIDNRMKTLLDALTIPTSDSGLGAPEADETPFYCLMESDKRVTQLSVTADRLLTPVGQPESQNHVHAIIGVNIEIAMEFRWGGSTYYRNA